MKKIISVILIFAICFCNLSLVAFAEDVTPQYTDEEKNLIYQKYIANEHMFNALFNDDTAVGYWRMVNNTEENGVLSWSIDAASKIIKEYPDKQKYAEILSNLIMMQSGNLAEHIATQSEFDDLKDGIDYTMDIVDIAAEFVGGAHLLETISPIIDAATGGKEVVIDNIEQAKYYQTTIQDYSQSKLLLEAVNKYAKTDELKSVSSSLLKANDTLLKKRLEYLSETTATIANYDAKFFVENLSFDLLKTADLYQSDETVKWFVDCGNNLADSILSIRSAGQFAFHMTMLAGNIGFGTTNTFNRYQEMKVLADIANAIVEANHNVPTPPSYDSTDALTTIQTKCNYYKLLITTHARGEYLVYQLLVNDAGVLSNFRALFDAFKEPNETTESWYNGQIDVMLKYYDILNNMFIINKTSPTTSDTTKVPTDAAEFKGHYYYIYDLDTVTTWEEAKEYCESQGGYLATVTSKEEDEFLYSYITDMGLYSVLFGLSDIDQENVWTWVTGEPFSYENWALGEPNHQGGYEHYGMYYEKNKDGTWNDGSGKTCPFLCEWGEYHKVAEKESALSDEEIIGAIHKASEFAYNWFWISDREHVDEYDTYVEYDENGNPWEYKRVTYEGISSLDDVLDLTKHYFTEEVAEELISQKDWHEQNNKIYVSEPDGLGGPEADYYDIKIVKENDIRYTITVYEYFGDELWENPYDVHLEYIDGYWVFDKILVCAGNSVPINVIEGDKSANDLDRQFDITGTWYSEEYDEVDAWASSYRTIFNPDGTVLQIGWRNEDHGTYEVSADGMCVTAYFKENYIDQPGDGMQLFGGYEYSVVYKLDPEKQCIYAAYSQEFKDAGYSNAEDGELQRNQ